jgi:hypothetical protein
MNLTDTKLNSMIGAYYKRLIDEYEKPAPPLEVSLSQGINPTSDLPSYLSDLDDVQQNLLLCLNSGNYDLVYEEADQLLDDQGITEIDKNHESYWKLCSELLNTEIKGAEYDKAQWEGKSTCSRNNRAGLDKETDQPSPGLDRIVKAFWN